MKIALDVMGGDHAPRQVLLGALDAVRSLDLALLLVGPCDLIQQELTAIAREQGRAVPDLEIVDAPEVVAFREHPSLVKERRRASIRVICELVQEGRADACVTMGHTGAAVISALLTFGRFNGVHRPCIGVPYFGLQPHTLLVDAGAIVNCKPEYLLQFAQLGSIYVEKVWGIARPTVGLMSNGREDNKGNKVTRAVFPLLQQSGLNFVGNIEGYDLPNGTANVVVADGFWGNIALKLTEALSEELIRRMRVRFSESGLGPAAEPLFDEFHALMDYARIGAMPVLGVNGLLLIGHGRSLAPAIVGALQTAQHAVQVDLLAALKDAVQ